MDHTLRILGIAGSLRKQSFNRSALRAAQQLAPSGAEVEILDLDGIPGFNEDEEQNLSPKVAELKQKIRAADAILIVTPEYNYSVPGVLKNAIDWASRPNGESAWDGKPVAIMGGLGRLKAQRGHNTTCDRCSRLRLDMQAALRLTRLRHYPQPESFRVLFLAPESSDVRGLNRCIHVQKEGVANRIG